MIDREAWLKEVRKKLDTGWGLDKWINTSIRTGLSPKESAEMRYGEPIPLTELGTHFLKEWRRQNAKRQVRSNQRA